MLWLAWDAVAAFRALVIAKMISVQKLSDKSHRVLGTSRSSHRGKLRTFHGRHCKCAGRPADLRRGFPHVFAGKWLRVLRKIFLLSAESARPAFQQKGV